MSTEWIIPEPQANPVISVEWNDDKTLYTATYEDGTIVTFDYTKKEEK